MFSPAGSAGGTEVGNVVADARKGCRCGVAGEGGVLSFFSSLFMLDRRRMAAASRSQTFPSTARQAPQLQRAPLARARCWLSRALAYGSAADIFYCLKKWSNTALTGIAPQLQNGIFGPDLSCCRKWQRHCVCECTRV